MPASDLDLLCINTVRTLSMDAVQAANSGHPGTPMALAPLAYVLYTRHVRHNPVDPQWINRDRVVLSCGHASMLLYSVLHLAGYDLSLDDLKAFRQWGSRTPGHPEVGHTPGVETTTGPLGQGVANAVGMAMAEAHLGAVFNRPNESVIQHHTWFIASDGDLMEGISHEAASLAGHLGLGRLIGFYDDNRITIDGGTDLSYSDDAAGRFSAYGWHVQTVEDINDLDALDAAIVAAKAETARPSLVVVRSHIGYGSPTKQDTADAHGAPLGEDEVRHTKDALGWPTHDPFHVPDEALAEWRKTRERGEALQSVWEKRYQGWSAAWPDLADELVRRLAGALPGGWETSVPDFTTAPGMATRKASGQVLNGLAGALPELMGGSADLSPSNNTLIKASRNFSAQDRTGRNVRFGIREHAMGGVLNGMALHGGVRPYSGTFLIFSDYMRPAMRLAAMMQQRVIYVFTHDSIGLGEDGPTHQPVEQLATLRAIPGLWVVRPADAIETAEAWKLAVSRRDGPVALAFTRQDVPALDRSHATGDGMRGAYVLAEASKKPRLVLLATGSEVQLAMAARTALESEGIPTRVVSAPCLEVFAAQDATYRDAVLPPGVRARLAIEAAHPLTWYRWVGDGGRVIGIERFGASAPWKTLYTEFGLTVDAVLAEARSLLA